MLRRLVVLAWLLVSACFPARTAELKTASVAPEPIHGFELLQLAEVRGWRVSSAVVPQLPGAEVWIAGLGETAGLDSALPLWIGAYDFEWRSLRQRIELPPLPPRAVSTTEVAVARVGERLMVLAGSAGRDVGGPLFLGVAAEDGQVVMPYRELAENGGAAILKTDGELIAAAWYDSERGRRLALLDTDGRVQLERELPTHRERMEVRVADLVVHDGQITVGISGEDFFEVQTFDRALQPRRMLRLPYANSPGALSFARS